MANPKILLLPGLDGDGFYLDALQQILSRDYTCERLSYPPVRRNYEDLCAWVVDQLDLESDYVIFAESFGGPLAIRVAEVLEKQAKAVIFCVTFCEPPTMRISLALTEWLYPRIIRFGWMANLLNFFIFNGLSPAAAGKLHRALLNVPNKVIAHRIRLLRSLDMRPASAALDMPCLVIDAAHDRLVRYRRFTHLANAEFKVIDGPHGLAGTKPSEVAEIMTRFIASLR